MYRHHNFAERLNIVSRLIAGESLNALSREFKLDKKTIRQWHLRYQKYGEDGLRGTRSFHYTAKEKLMIVEEYLKKEVPLQEICLRYNLNHSTVRGWVRRIQLGFSLENMQRGRPPKRMGRPKKKIAQTELERLQVENLRLRAENALLKKVKALVEEQEARARLNGQKPSMN